MEAAPGNMAVELRVERVQDHLADGRTEILDGARWRWIDEEAAALQPQILAELEAPLADRDHALDRHAGAIGDVGRHAHLCFMSRSESRSLGSVIIFM